jgi:hypothetical protein
MVLAYLAVLVLAAAAPLVGTLADTLRLADARMAAELARDRPPGHVVLPEEARGVWARVLLALSRGSPCLWLLAYAAALAVPVLPLALYHVSLLRKGVTTNEDVRSRFAGESPYNRGFWGNLRRALCERPDPAFVPRLWVDGTGKPWLPADVSDADAEQWMRGEGEYARPRHWTEPLLESDNL